MLSKYATKNDIAMEWVPIKEALKVKMMTIDGKFLRTNNGMSPWSRYAQRAT